MKYAPPRSYPEAGSSGGGPHPHPEQIRRPRRTRSAGFTLVEILAALLMMAIVIPVAMEGMSIASRAGILGQRKAAAMRVADRVLNELLVHGEARNSSTSGVTVEGDVSYPWTMRAESWPEDTMQHVTVTVTFTLQGNEYNVNVSTLLSPSTEDLEAAAAAAGTPSGDAEP